MIATAELQLIPLGEGVSVREKIGRVVDLLSDHDLIIETHAMGTNIEGKMIDILAAIGEIHAVLHSEGSTRLISYIKLETRTDKVPSLEAKRL
ncbi:MAG: MTH1187 family thiamine-binding protein [Gammaproteobacteria bacterium]|nr:MTH1187 family thiamine-binding protein [Gammaproteobacteria bacterium]NIN62516.1 MTH1187 family thiamine-binding protein [Gammaproteobacteria bacterium]NIO63080.1 MTH1187 family thiamine-binding protein [Gammaproteobacteria bacterium]NIP48457.1 MTH1187 family thiamine-binding protein [Gammaproteobacteria bacterium]NIQ08491.1 MTH1187 family thiamine-binding protein [Gammaproteobacteria bacterium]